jgi:hypothetical protein
LYLEGGIELGSDLDEALTFESELLLGALLARVGTLSLRIVLRRGRRRPPYGGIVKPELTSVDRVRELFDANANYGGGEG